MQQPPHAAFGQGQDIRRHRARATQFRGQAQDAFSARGSGGNTRVAGAAKDKAVGAIKGQLQGLQRGFLFRRFAALAQHRGRITQR